MIREEFMDTAEKKIQELFSFLHGSITDLIAQAYMEGQKEAKVEQILELVRAACNRMDTTNAEPESEPESEPKMCSCWHYVQIGTLGDEPVYGQRCWGTPERDICTCGGDKSKCNFYEKVKQND